MTGLQRYTVPVGQAFGAPLAAGLWLSQPVIAELMAHPSQIGRLQETLAAGKLVTYTLNAFPYGDFHSERVKEQVYLPDWTHPARLEYTLNCARVLCQLLPMGIEGTLSTVPLGFKALSDRPDFQADCIANLICLARSLDEIHDDTGQVIRLAIEPEPLCVLETTGETVQFFANLRAAAIAAGAREVVERHVGVCYDVCHQAVEFEDVAASVHQLEDVGIRINKVHITCAIELPPTREALEALMQYVEPRYLHQTFARSREGRIARIPDLNREHCVNPPADFADADLWRVHYHVPVDAEAIGPLRTTRGDLQKALEQVQKLTYAPHLEVETYTWGVLPSGEKPDLVTGLTRELQATRTLLGGLVPSR